RHGLCLEGVTVQPASARCDSVEEHRDASEAQPARSGLDRVLERAGQAASTDEETVSDLDPPGVRQRLEHPLARHRVDRLWLPADLADLDPETLRQPFTAALRASLVDEDKLETLSLSRRDQVLEEQLDRPDLRRIGGDDPSG